MPDNESSSSESSDNSESTGSESSDPSNSEGGSSSSSESDDFSSSESRDSSSSENGDSSSSESDDSSDSSESSDSSDSSSGSSCSSTEAEIKRDEDEVNDDWKTIEGQLAKALPGQKINLRIELPESSTGSDFQWTLPDKVFKDYTAVTAKGELKPMEANDLNQQEVYFYWADSGSKAVKVKYKEDGVDREMEVTIEVEKPTATLEATQSASVIDWGGYDNNRSIRHLHVEGVTFTGSVSVSDDWGTGKWSFVQLVTPKCSAKADPSQDDPSVSQDGGTYFDGGPYPYAGTFDLGATDTAFDNPNHPLRSYMQYKADMSFQMYIMFTPPGSESKEVPLLRLPWSWIDAAIYNDEDPFNPWKKLENQRDPAVEIGTATEDNVHPVWTDSSDNHDRMQ